MSVTDLRLIPRVETYPRVVRFAQSPPGKLVLLAVFALGLHLHGRAWWLDMTVIVALATWWPGRRRTWIALGTLYWLARFTPFPIDVAAAVARAHGIEANFDWRMLRLGAIASTLAFCAGFEALMRGKLRCVPHRRPVASLLLAYAALLFIASSSPMPAGVRVLLWAFLAVLGRYLWFLALSLAYPDPGTRATVRVASFLPFWFGGASTSNPLPKGQNYWRKIEAKSDVELAVCQLKALKLLLWAGVLLFLYKLLQGLTHPGQPGLPAQLGVTFEFAVPRLALLLRRHAGGQSFSLIELWAGLGTSFLLDLLFLAVWGHVLVACCRMTGFRALRNTWRPLQSRSIADFWNRYYFYFKELLVDLFFYPAFLRYFKGRPRLRRFFATLAAATFGNFVLHYFRNLEAIAAHGPWSAFRSMSAYLVYTLVLGLGIGLSQLRADARKRRVAGRVAGFATPLAVLGFYCVLRVFDVETAVTLADRFRFVLAIFGIDAR